MPSPSRAKEEGDDAMPIIAGIDDGVKNLDHGHDNDASPSQTLHDLLSLGEIEPALSSYKFPPPENGESSTQAAAAAADCTVSAKDKVGDGLGVRLPLLLRWLSVAQPLAADASSSSDQRSSDRPSESAASSSSSGLGLSLPDPNTIVPLLEDVAAAHPDAENVEVLVSSLAPSICKEAVGKLSPLSRNTKEGLLFRRGQIMINTGKSDLAADDYFCTATWNTKNLDVALQRLANPANAPANQSRKRQKERTGSEGRKKQKVESKEDPLLQRMKMVIDLLKQDDDDDDDDDDAADNGHAEEKDEAALSSFFAQASSAANDTHESIMRRVLQDLLTLVKSSLRTTDDKHNDGSGGGAVEGGVDEGGVTSPSESNPFLQETGFSTPRLALKSDSLFAETNDVSSSFGGGWSRLSVMIPILMQHAPILRYEHVAVSFAFYPFLFDDYCWHLRQYGVWSNLLLISSLDLQNAICRAAVPQAPTLIKVMAANSGSAATQSLLRGCVTAYQLAVKYECHLLRNPATDHGEEGDVQTRNSSEARDIIRAAVESAQCLASLSRREALNIIRILKEQKVMDGLVLSLLIKHDPICAGSFIVEKLSSSLLTADASNRTVSASAHDRQEKSKVMKRVIPIRQRMIKRQSLGIAPAPMEKTTHDVTKTTKSPLYEELAGDKTLAESVRRFVSQHIINLLKTKADGDSISLGVRILCTVLMSRLKQRKMCMVL